MPALSSFAASHPSFPHPFHSITCSFLSPSLLPLQTAYYSFYLPIACGLILAGAPPSALEATKGIALEMGRYFQVRFFLPFFVFALGAGKWALFSRRDVSPALTPPPPLSRSLSLSLQVQDDYLDAFGDPAAIGKVGTDIQDNKCSWLVCTALATATPAQRAVIEANYGKEDEASVAAIKALYAEMDLEGKFRAYEAESYAALTAAIEGQSDVPAGVFTAMLAKIYKRQK